MQLLHKQIQISLEPFKDLLDNPEITDIYIDSWDKVYVKKNGKLEDVENRFEDNKFIEVIVSQLSREKKFKVDEDNPYLDTILPDSSARFNIVVNPIVNPGPCITIRKFGKNRLTAEDLIKFGAITREGFDIIESLVTSGKTILISGATNTGKTTLLNIICNNYIDESYGRIITIEDTRELKLNKKYWIPMIVDIADLDERERAFNQVLNNTFRMDPSNIILGEIRGSESYTLLRAFFSGHQGMATIHAESGLKALHRFKILLKERSMQDQDKKDMIKMGIDVVIHAKKIKGKRTVEGIYLVSDEVGTDFSVKKIY